MKLKKFKFGDLVRIKESEFWKYEPLKGLIGIYIRTGQYQDNQETTILIKNKFYYSFWDNEFEKI